MNFIIDTMIKVIVFEVCFCFGSVVLNPVLRHFVALAVN
jgi:hypothetical protein